MGRIRSIKPEFHAHEELSALPAETHLLAAALTNYADDYGYFNANPGLVKAGTHPLRNDATPIRTQLDQLAAMNYIEVRLCKDGKLIGRITNFLAHQKVAHPTDSKLKARFDEAHESSRTSHEEFVKPPETFSPEQGTGNREQGTGNGEELPDASHPRPPAPQPDQPESPELDSQEDPEPCDEPEMRKAIERIWDYYCRKLERDPKRYTLTEARRKKARTRLRERSKLADLATALLEAKRCVDNLAASGYHTEGGYIDWTEQIFRSAEEFEKRLNWVKPTGGSNGNYKSKTESSIDAAREAIRRISERALDCGATDEACYTPSIPPIPGRLRSLGSGSGLF